MLEGIIGNYFSVRVVETLKKLAKRKEKEHQQLAQKEIDETLVKEVKPSEAEQHVDILA